MGKEAEAPASPEGELWGVRNLRVVDASLMPGDHQREFKCGGDHDGRENRSANVRYCRLKEATKPTHSGKIT